MTGKKGTQRNTRGTDGSNVRPWSTGIEADHPLCQSCTWVRAGGRFKLKFVSRACGQHGKLL